MCKTLRDVGLLIAAWWRRDRIRVAPAEGRLLRLRPSCRLLILGEAAEVVSRAVDAGGVALVYQCRTAAAEGTLIVHWDARTEARRIEWRDGRGAVDLAPDDIEVYAGP